MAFNSISGTIPASLGNLQDMKQMWLYANQLTGTIPTELGNIPVSAFDSLQIKIVF